MPRSESPVPAQYPLLPYAEGIVKSWQDATENAVLRVMLGGHYYHKCFGAPRAPHMRKRDFATVRQSKARAVFRRHPMRAFVSFKNNGTVAKGFLLSMVEGTEKRLARVLVRPDCVGGGAVHTIPTRVLSLTFSEAPLWLPMELRDKMTKAARDRREHDLVDWVFAARAMPEETDAERAHALFVRTHLRRLTDFYAPILSDVGLEYARTLECSQNAEAQERIVRDAEAQERAFLAAA